MQAGARIACHGALARIRILLARLAVRPREALWAPLHLAAVASPPRKAETGSRAALTTPVMRAGAQIACHGALARIRILLARLAVRPREALRARGGCSARFGWPTEQHDVDCEHHHQRLPLARWHSKTSGP